MHHFRITVDTGGTFSDFVFLNETTGETTIAKVPSTPNDPSMAILTGIETFLSEGRSANEIGLFCHGTTVGTNALLEAKGAKTALLVTHGFTGIYEVAEQARPHGSAIFNVQYKKPLPLVPASMTVEVVERVDSDGNVLTPLDEADLRKKLHVLKQRGVESLAVCFLFSFLEPKHELRVREIIAEEIPDCEVSLSCEIIPQIREYYRLSTTVINAYLQPILARYIRNLGERLDAIELSTPQKYIMQSNGGMATFAATSRKGVATVLSGPAGGVTASVAVAKETGFNDLITFDMGGTSCDVALIKDGKPVISNRGKVEGRDISMPMMDINTVSAGGGTLAHVDDFNVLQVGPRSAGAVPGPACYGRGGDEPTITDCNLVLGYLPVGNFLGGNMELNHSNALNAVKNKIADPLKIDVLDAAEGIVRIIDVKMQEAIKAISTMRGHDLRDFMLLPFGGAGPIHAGRMVRELNLAGAVIPLHPGVFSAMGLVMSDVKHDYVRSHLYNLDIVAPKDISAVFEQMEQTARHDLTEEGFCEDKMHIQHLLDLRYAGQGYELTLPVDAVATATDLVKIKHDFDAEHEKMFGHSAEGETVEIVSFRIEATGVVQAIDRVKFTREGADIAQACLGKRTARFDGQDYETTIYQREKLDVGHQFDGPAVVEQFDCTTVILPEQKVRVDEYKNLILTVRK